MPRSAGGIEITFLDPTGSGFLISRLFRQFAQSHAVVANGARDGCGTGCVPYAFGLCTRLRGRSLDLYMYTANFRESERETAMETYMGVPMAALTPSGNSQVMLDRDVVVYDRSLRPVFGIACGWLKL